MAVMLLLFAGCGGDDPSGPTETEPTVTTASVTAITQTTAQGGGNVTSNGGAALTARGVCWSTTADPTIADDTTNNGTATGSFTSNITGLSPATTYHARAYATNSVGTAYGGDSSFTTLPLAAPTLTTASVTNIMYTTAECGGNVISDGGSTVTARGVCWSTTANPTIADDTTNNGTGTGNFTSNLTGLTENTTYHVRAYAVNAQGTSYGSEESFSTLALSVPTVATASVSAITYTSAQCGGDVTSDGGLDVTDRGVCWSTTTAPTIADDTTNDGTGTGSFTSNLTGLTVNTTYYVRAYAINSLGTSYGSEVSFSTLAYTVPVLTTISVSAIDYTTAQSGGNITSDGGRDVTARGVCWSESQNPTIADNTTSDGSGTGSFTSDLTGLSDGTLYYVRAYATNSEGTGYGDEVSFTTLAYEPPAVSTTSIITRTLTTSQGGGDVTFNGGGALTVDARGLCWSISHDPTIADDHSTDGIGMGTYTSNITGLTEGTVYYARAYATNIVGTGYGEEVMFKGGRVFDYDGNEYTIVQIGSQWWLVENLMVTHYRNGDAIPNITNDAEWPGLSTGGYGTYGNDEQNVDTANYGRLYNWFAAVDARNIAPLGWHAPSDAEWQTLEIAHGMSPATAATTGLRATDREAEKIREVGDAHWDSHVDITATNLYGFTALAGGYRSNGDGTYRNIRRLAHFWTTTERYNDTAWIRRIEHDEWRIRYYDQPKTTGFSVRCVRD
jgi:uncharacterized protein (TIGR02145 family)